MIFIAFFSFFGIAWTKEFIVSVIAGVRNTFSGSFVRSSSACNSTWIPRWPLRPCRTVIRITGPRNSITWRCYLFESCDMLYYLYSNSQRNRRSLIPNLLWFTITLQSWLSYIKTIVFFSRAFARKYSSNRQNANSCPLLTSTSACSRATRPTCPFGVHRTFLGVASFPFKQVYFAGIVFIFAGWITITASLSGALTCSTSSATSSPFGPFWQFYVKQESKHFRKEFLRT